MFPSFWDQDQPSIRLTKAVHWRGGAYWTTALHCTFSCSLDWKRRQSGNIDTLAYHFPPTVPCLLHSSFSFIIQRARGTEAGASPAKGRAAFGMSSPTSGDIGTVFSTTELKSQFLLEYFFLHGSSSVRSPHCSALFSPFCPLCSSLLHSHRAVLFKGWVTLKASGPRKYYPAVLQQLQHLGH